MLPVRGPPLLDATAYVTVRAPVPRGGPPPGEAKGLIAVIHPALKPSAQPQVEAVLIVKDPKPPAAVNDSPVGVNEYVQGARKLALIVGGLVPELTVNGFVLVLGPPLTVAE
jgi:hypothetical protein